MNFVSIRIVTADVPRVIAFYEAVTERPARRYTEDFAEIATPACTLAIAGTRTLTPFGGDIARASANRSVIVEFRSDDVDAAYARLLNLIGGSVVQAPTDMPWGNRSLLFRDTDENLVNIFTPITKEAIARFGS
ncbi:VOC family protein (plasmid) [Methylobacterium sp. NMS12]|uniref:VOC family protein n=1 Tax=Methylobacterium sp. NMS12 TaxID=3079766 RepID=UPI003F884D4B